LNSRALVRHRVASATRADRGSGAALQDEECAVDAAQAHGTRSVFGIP